MTTLIATEIGYDNIKVREVGEEFNWPDTRSVVVGGEAMEVANPIPSWAKVKRYAPPAENLE